MKRDSVRQDGLQSPACAAFVSSYCVTNRGPAVNISHTRSTTDCCCTQAISLRTRIVGAIGVSVIFTALKPESTVRGRVWRASPRALVFPVGPSTRDLALHHPCPHALKRTGQPAPLHPSAVERRPIAPSCLRATYVSGFESPPGALD